MHEVLTKRLIQGVRDTFEAIDQKTVYSARDNNLMIDQMRVLIPYLFDQTPHFSAEILINAALE